MLECREILPVEFLQIFDIEAFAVLAEMGAALKFFDELYCGCIICFDAVGIVADNIDPGGTAFSAGAYQRAIVPCRCESYLKESLGQPRRIQVLVQLRRRSQTSKVASYGTLNSSSWCR